MQVKLEHWCHVPGNYLKDTDVARTVVANECQGHGEGRDVNVGHIGHAVPVFNLIRRAQFSGDTVVQIGGLERDCKVDEHGNRHDEPDAERCRHDVVALVVDQVEARVLAQTNTHFAVIFDLRNGQHTRDDYEQEQHEGNDRCGGVEESGFEVQCR